MTAEGNTGLIWESRLALWLPRPVLFGAFLIAACLSAAYLSFQWFFGFCVHKEPFVFSLIIAFILMFAFRDGLDRQQSSPEVPHRHETEVRGLHLSRDSIRVSSYAGAAGVLAFFGLTEVFLIVSGADLVGPWIQLHEESVTLAMNVLGGWFFGRGSYFSLTSSSDLPGPQRSDIDLLNLEDLYYIGRSGLRLALVWLVLVSIMGLFFLDSGVWVLLLVCAIYLGIAVVVLLRPVRGVQRLIRALKREELALLATQIRAARDDVLTGDVSTQGRLTDLISYEARIASVSEWPFDSSTILRFGLYLLIPVASMVGGALVERIVDLLLD